MLTLRYLVLFGWFLTALSLACLILFAIPAVIQLRKTLKALEESSRMLSQELKPTLQNSNALTAHLAKRLEGVDNLLDLLNPLQMATRETRSYLQRLVKSPRSEVAGLVAGVKKAVDIAKDRFGKSND